MKVSTLFEKLSYGELSNLGLANEGNGTIVDKHKPRMVLFANEALLRLYTKFLIYKRELIIELKDGKTVYPLDPAFSTTGVDINTPELAYILDTVDEPFIGNVIKIHKTVDDNGCEISLNDDAAKYSIFSKDYKTLRIPDGLNSTQVGVIYQAKHEEIPDDDLEYEIDIPDVIVKALTSHIAYQVYSNINGLTSTAKANEHLSMYNAICQEVIERDILSTSISTSNDRFERGGWK